MASSVQERNWYHTNKYTAEAACEHCGGVVRHERWCLTHNAVVAYAHAVARDAEKLMFEDQLILHALGVAW